jgi:hypothetical protein
MLVSLRGFYSAQNEGRKDANIPGAKPGIGLPENESTLKDAMSWPDVFNGMG